MRDILSQDPGAGENFSFKISGKDAGEKRRNGCLLTAYLCQALKGFFPSIIIITFFCVVCMCMLSHFSCVRHFVAPWSPPGSSVHRIFQARILEWPFPSPGDLPDPGLLCGTWGSTEFSQCRRGLKMVTRILCHPPMERWCPCSSTWLWIDSVTACLLLYSRIDSVTVWARAPGDWQL